MRDVSGVKQDHRGKFYRVVEVVNRLTGRAECIRLDTHQPNGAVEAARMIPVPVESKPQVMRKPTATTSNAPKRLHILECRRQGQKEKHIEEDQTKHQQNITAVRCLLRSPDCGKTWVPAEPVTYDWYVCYHLDSPFERA